MTLKTEEWVNGYFLKKVVDSEKIYISVSKPGFFEKTAVLENSEINGLFAEEFKTTLVEYIATLSMPDGGYAVIAPQLTDFQKKLIRMNSKCLTEIN